MLHKIQIAMEKMNISFEDETIIAAVSGGRDSLTLLRVLHMLQPHFGYNLHTVTFDHQLRGESSHADAEFVRSTAEAWGIPVTIGSEDVQKLAETLSLSLEAAARQARYTFLAEVALAEGAAYIALGHHRDDQTETILMHLLRGAGLAGLRGMLPVAPLSETHLREDASDAILESVDEIQLIRPFLDVPRAEIHQFATQYGIIPREDETNLDTKFFRNRIRHEVLPVLEKVRPDFSESLGRMAAVVQKDYEIVQSVVQKAVARLVDWAETEDGEIAFLDRHAFLAELPGVQRYVLRDVLGELSYGEIPYTQIETACDLIASGSTGQQLSLPGDVQLTVGYDDFTIHYGGARPFPRHIPHLQPGQVVHLELEGQGFFTETMRFYTYWVVDGRSTEIFRDDPLEATLAVKPGSELMLRTRRPGDRFVPLGLEGHSQKISDVFINLKIPKNYRDRVPLLVVNDEIAWFVAPTVNGLQGRIAAPFAVTPTAESVLRVRWTVQD